MDSFIIPAADLLSLAKSLAAHAADANTTRPSLAIGGVHVEVSDDGAITMTATDGYRLLQVKAPTISGHYPNARQVIDGHTATAGVKVPHAALVQALKAMKTKGDHMIRLSAVGVGGVLWLATMDDLRQDADPEAPIGSPVRIVGTVGDFRPMKLNRKFLLDAVVAVGPDNTVAGCVELVQTETAETPLLVQGGLPDATLLVMPARF